jgi:hypothetical protein
MRTTINLDEELLREAKHRAATSGRTLGAVIEDAVRDSFSRRAARGKAKRVRLSTFRGRGTLPGVDLDNSASLLDLMEGR